MKANGLSKETEKYFADLGGGIEKNYAVAREARGMGLDPVDDVEVPLALTMAAKVVRLIATKYPQLDNEDIINRVLELEKEYGALDNTVSFIIAEEIAREKYCKFETQLEAMDAGIRVGWGYTTLGVVSTPIEGYTGIKTGKTKLGETYLKAFFSGPIRSAGTTAMIVGTILIDYIRQVFGYAKFDPTETECKRVVTELYDYHERITNLQYLPTEDEALFIVRNLSIQIAGDPTEKREVSNYKDLNRVESDFIRGGLCLIIGEGLAQKAKKGLRILRGIQKNGLKVDDWEWLEEYVELQDKREKGKTDSSPTYIKDLVAGRPVFGHPGKGFRFRYGRSRAAGFSAVSIHPATMAVTDGFIATGTQLKIEKPSKGCIVTPCDQIDGPIVKFKNGSVKKLQDYSEAKVLYDEVEEILYLGDILFPLGDVINRNAQLPKPGYVEEWWRSELESRKGMVKDELNVSMEDAVKLSKKYKVPLHPGFIFYWSQLNYGQFLGFVDWFQHSRINDGKLLFPYNSSERERFKVGKRALELLGIDHSLSVENVVIDKISTQGLLINLGFEVGFNGELHINYKFKKFDEFSSGFNEGNEVLKIVNEISNFVIKDKAGEFIGTRMGRPEKAKLRKLTGSPHILFPVGDEGGRLRSVNEAVEVGSVRGDFPFNYCKDCKRETIYRKCESCGAYTEKKYYCRLCKSEVNGKCQTHEIGNNFKNIRIDMKYYFDKARESLGLMKVEMPELIKGVRGTSSENHDVENIVKGILRSKYNLCVNKDGTIRYDMTEIPLSHFRPNEIGVNVERLKELGYLRDYNGDELVDEDQVLELKPHDVLIPCNDLSGDEKGDDVFINIANYVDELLEKFYDLPRFFNVKTRDDLIGQLGVCMAPHNCAGVICRFIGFTKVQGLVASPYLHAAMRRDCVYPTTNFVYYEDGMVKNGQIGDYVEDLIKKGNGIKKIDSFGTERIEIGKEKRVYAFGVDPKTKKLKKKKIKYFIKGKPPEKWIEMKTCSGRRQIMTPRHKFIYLDKDNNFKIKRASEIKKGDRVALMSKFDSFNTIENINLVDILCEMVPIDDLKNIRIVKGGEFFKKVIGKIRIRNKGFLKELDFNRFNGSADWYKLIPLSDVKKFVENGFLEYEDIPINCKIRTIFNTKEWDLRFKITKDLMSIFGYYSAEGYSRQNKSVSQVCFRMIDGIQRKKLVNSIKNTFGLGISYGEDKTKITLSNKLVYFLFEYCFKIGSTAYEKRVPDIIYNVSGDMVKEYLSCYFDGDGTIVYKKNKFVCFYSVCRGLLDGISLLLSRFGVFGRFYRTKERLPGKRVLDRYRELNKKPKKHVLNHLVYSGKDFYEIVKILNPSNKHKKSMIRCVDFKKTRERRIFYNNHYLSLQEIGDIFVDVVKDVSDFKDRKPSYCFDIDHSSEEDKNVMWGEQVINFRCDGDEAAMMLLLDVLINFSRKFLSAHRGATQDAPLVLNGKILAKEVDDQILDFELVNNYPLELYEKAEKGMHSSEIEIEMVKQRIGRDEDPYINTGFTHDVKSLNDGVLCSSYKILPSMREKVEGQMMLCEKLRSVDHGDVARLIIDRHFMRDLKGNLRKFTQQNFRCGKCNEIYRRVPLNGKCSKCNNPKLIFTISYGSIVKYLEPALDLTRNYDVPVYIKQDLELTKKYIEGIFGKDNEKQEALEKWF